MITKLSLLTARSIVRKNGGCKYDLETYQYGFFILYSSLLMFLISTILGVLFKTFIESVVFYFAFLSIRQFAGGYHASTEIRCDVITLLSIFMCLVVIRLTKTYDLQTLLVIASTISAVCIFVLSPLDTPEKPLTDTEYKYFRKISWLILSLIFVVVVVTYFAKFNILFAPCCMSLILEAILLIAGKIKKVYQTKNASE